MLYKQLDAPLRTVGRALLQADTMAVIESQVQSRLQDRMTSLIARQQAVAAPLHQLLRQAGSGVTPDPAYAGRLAAQARSVVAAARRLAEQTLLR